MQPAIEQLTYQKILFCFGMHIASTLAALQSLMVLQLRPCWPHNMMTFAAIADEQAQASRKDIRLYKIS